MNLRRTRRSFVREDCVIDRLTDWGIGGLSWRIILLVEAGLDSRNGENRWYLPFQMAETD